MDVHISSGLLMEETDSPEPLANVLSGLGSQPHDGDQEGIESGQLHSGAKLCDPPL
jgi:hypothetical protein